VFDCCVTTTACSTSGHDAKVVSFESIFDDDRTRVPAGDFDAHNVACNLVCRYDGRRVFDLDAVCMAIGDRVVRDDWTGIVGELDANDFVAIHSVVAEGSTSVVEYHSEPTSVDSISLDCWRASMRHQDVGTTTGIDAILHASHASLCAGWSAADQIHPPRYPTRARTCSMIPAAPSSWIPNGKQS
jgi:hypothetical protein